MNNEVIGAITHGFGNFIMTSSFCVVTLGLADFLAAGLKMPKIRFRHAYVICATYIPPLLFALFYPHGFILGLKYASFFVAILLVILPALMAMSLDKSRLSKSRTLVLVAIIAIGIIVSGITML